MDREGYTTHSFAFVHDKRLEGEVAVKQLVQQSQYLIINLVLTGLYSQ